jgi:hypothetical protein
VSRAVPVDDEARVIPFVPERAATAIVESRRDVVQSAERLTLAIEILRHLGMSETVPILEDLVQRLRQVGFELRDVAT